MSLDIPRDGHRPRSEKKKYNHNRQTSSITRERPRDVAAIVHRPGFAAIRELTG